MTMDDLIARLKVRAADPERRVDAPETELGASISSMGLADVFGMLGGVAGDLARVVEANQAGRALSPDLLTRADELGSSMTTLVDSELPPTATPETLDHAEAVLGRTLPAAFRRIYGEVADGGFGPGRGLLGLDAILSTYRDLVADPPAPAGLAWPEQMVPLVHVDPGYYCLKLPGGQVIDWDPEDTNEWQDENGWAQSFSQTSPNIETWLDGWVSSRTPAEEHAEALALLRREEMLRTRERIAAMSPAERAAVGLPDEGWEEAYRNDVDDF